MNIELAVYLLRHMIFLLIFLPIFIVVFVILTLLTIAWIRILLHKAAVHRAQKQAWRERHDEQGRPLPPVSRGVCQQCGRYFHRIYYLPDGSRVCEECYQPAEESATSSESTK